MDKTKIGAEELYLVPEQKEFREAVDEVSSFREEKKKNNKKAMRVSEVKELRSANRKVFRMSDGTQQAVFYPGNVHVTDAETGEQKEVDQELILEEDGRHYRNGKGNFTARFSCEEDNDELFSVEEGNHRITVLTKKNKKQHNKGVKAKQHKKKELLFENVEAGSDFEYAVNSSGVKENIIVKEKADVYHYTFTLKCENVEVSFDETNKKVSFVDCETKEDVFVIPAPFMQDENGVVSTAVSYEVKTASSGEVQLTVTADREWMNAKERKFPVIIDPQIKLAGGAYSMNFSWREGEMYEASLSSVGKKLWRDGVFPMDSGHGTANNLETALELNLNTVYRGCTTYSEDEIWYRFTTDSGAGTYVFRATGIQELSCEICDIYGIPISTSEYVNDTTSGSALYLDQGEVYFVKLRSYSGYIGGYSLVGLYLGEEENGSSALWEFAYLTDRMYLEFGMPTLPKNARVRRAELILTQESGITMCDQYNAIGLYHVTDELTTGECTPTEEGELVDYAKMRSGNIDSGNTVTYEFDITKVLDENSKNDSYILRFVVRMMDESLDYDNHITIFGCNDDYYCPVLAVTYETDYSVNTSESTLTHQIGSFGQGSVDLVTGNLMFETVDFAWSGNRMPVTLKHLFTGALAGYQYTENQNIELCVGDYSAMYIGHGFKLNLMQSLKRATVIEEDSILDGYVYVDEHGEETYFCGTEDRVDSEGGFTYAVWLDTADKGMEFTPHNNTLKIGEEKLVFDECGRLICTTDQYGNSNSITYTEERIASVIDGAGREFGFAYDENGFLVSIIGPDNTCITYGYEGELLTEIVYPDGKKVVLTWESAKPKTVEMQEVDGTLVYKVDYTYNGDKVQSVSEYGVEDGNYVLGVSSVFYYALASCRTIVETIEPADINEDETEDTMIKTVYAFDDNGEIISNYAYTENSGNVGVEGSASGIHPYAGENGMRAVSNINNLLRGHNFESLEAWELVNAEYSEILTEMCGEDSAKYGQVALKMQNFDANCMESGVSQSTIILPKGEYTFSAYMKVAEKFAGAEQLGGYIRVLDQNNTILAVSEHLNVQNTEYLRLVAPFEISSAQSVKVEILTDGMGMVYVDAAQLEKNTFANAYNMLQNGSFENDEILWEINGYWDDISAWLTTEQCFDMSQSLAMTGELTTTREAYQDVVVKTERTTRETFTLSGWAKGYGASVHDRTECEMPQFRLRAVIQYSDATYKEYGQEEFVADFSPCTEEWQFVSIQFSKSKYRKIQYVRIYCEYNYNAGVVYFDNIQLVRDSIETNLSIEDFVEPFDEEETIDFDTTETTENIEGVEEFEELLDAYGNTLTETTYTDGEFGTIYRSFGFNVDNTDIIGDNSGNDLICETDACGYKTMYKVDENASRNTEVTDRCGNKTAYEYDAAGRTTKVISKNVEGQEIAHVAYAYDTFDNMTEIMRGDGLKYALSYNAYHNLDSIGVDGMEEPLVRYTYKNGNERLKEVTYANGNVMKVSYNSLGQMNSEKWYNVAGELTAHYKHVYDGNDNIVRSIDIFAKKEYNYVYEAEQLTRAAEYDIVFNDEGMVVGKMLVHAILYNYNSEGRMTRKTFATGEEKEWTVFFENTDENNPISRFEVGGKTVTSHSKTDSFGRKVFDELQFETGFASRQFSYHVGQVTETHKEGEKLKSAPTTQLVERIILSDGRMLSYEYDPEERITKVTDSVSGVTEYTYDALGQLLTETVNGVVVNEMTYDNYGNILGKNGERYTYGDIAWKDRLTAVDGRLITYDAQGNPTNYFGYELTWEKGRQLKSFEDNTYTYNVNGIRTSKIVNGVEHIYTLDGTNILKEVWGDNELVPMYDNEGSVCGIIYNKIPFFFLKNLQGDIIAVVDQSSEVVGSYTYDAWGVCTIESDTSGCNIAMINPYRYRGYYYDAEIGMYYLQSRYYDPAVGRFICADKVMGANGELSTYDLYTYCGNEPIGRYEIGGMSWRKSWKKIKRTVRTTLNKTNRYLVSLGIDTALLAKFFLNMYKDGKGIYHAKFDCWQQFFGYNDFYDFMFDIGTSMKNKKFIFKSKGRSYVLWAWKGNYINLGAGAELGIYFGGGPHWYVDKSLAMNMTLTLKYRGSRLFSYSMYTWWITGFDPRRLTATANDLRATYVVKFKTNKMYTDFKKEHERQWSFNRYNRSASYTF